MRLMTAEAGSETPMDKYVRFKNNINLWYEEMKRYGLTDQEVEALKPHFLKSHGVPPSQEQLMTMLMDEKICNFSLADANAARKTVGKKLMDKIPKLHQQILTQAKSSALGKYVWDCGVGPQMGYSFSVIHALAYSFIAYQSAYIATKWNPIYWDTACLIVNSGSLEEDDENSKKKMTDYAKIASAIGSISERGIKFSLVNINQSDYGFKPDIKNNRILYGLNAISGINSEAIEQIKNHRPYAGIKDFISKVNLKKPAVVNLIKAGAFDEIDNDFNNNRINILAYYLMIISEPKSKLNLQNFSSLIAKNLIPKELEMQVKVFNFNKYIKTHKFKDYYTIDEPSAVFLKRHYNEWLSNNIEAISGTYCISQSKWDKLYKIEMDAARDYLKDNQEKVLNEYNTLLFKEVWDKYADRGNLSKQEMTALCFYYHEHELAHINNYKYGIVDFNTLNPISEVDYYFKRGGNEIPIYKLSRIAGTVLAKNDNKTSVTLLTTSGVVVVKFTREYYAMFKSQLSSIGADGKKHVEEKGWFGRGNILVVTGYRREDNFIAKTYKNTQFHQLYRITDIIGEDIKITHDRWSGANMVEEDIDEDSWNY